MVVEQAQDLTDHSRMGEQGNGATRVTGGYGLHCSPATVPEFLVALASRPTEVHIILPQIGLPDRRVASLNLGDGLPLEPATMDFPEFGGELEKPAVMGTQGPAGAPGTS